MVRLRRSYGQETRSRINGHSCLLAKHEEEWIVSSSGVDPGVHKIRR